ncbi:alkaline phosphatase family protein [Stappia sp. F7233]|uniref:Alkaline phosphatase family protein n=1 Tax=Stappia albiluteola TaxID=2758565 RepID=A0A839AH29_9HYPH|nr:alkaline phosphatase family protein [Stappia albiluteola]MBA5779001.1 alkaline phosphatase family protein [Stappia albiluteola]
MAKDKRVLVIGLDGFEISLAEAMMRRGDLPNLQALKERSARFLLDHGEAKYSGLAWEHVSTGLTPEAIDRHAAVSFDSQTYTMRQDPTSNAPFFSAVKSKAVVFDLPYCDLDKAEGLKGVTAWGAHDPGVKPHSRPAGLHEELAQRFGPYPAPEFIYGFTWPSARKTEEAGAALCRAVLKRRDCAIWLLKERLPDWNLAMVVVSEAHSGLEILWHGVDRDHPLHEIPSAEPARKAVCDLYHAIDILVGDLAAAFSDAEIVTFSMHGMGTNDADVPSMVLLPELMYRRSFGKPYMRAGRWRLEAGGKLAMLDDKQNWGGEMYRTIPKLAEFKDVQGVLDEPFAYDPARAERLEWMPTLRYRPFWPKMDAFAIPAFYDGQIRLNMAGREAAGMVPHDRYRAKLDEIERFLADCRDIATGKPAIADIVRTTSNPSAIGPTQADIRIRWSGCPLGLQHPQAGTIGPVPMRRTGGHSGPYGFVYFAGDRWQKGDGGIRNSFDVVPTVLAGLGEAEALKIVSGSPVDAKLGPEGERRGLPGEGDEVLTAATRYALETPDISRADMRPRPSLVSRLFGRRLSA